MDCQMGSIAVRIRAKRKTPTAKVNETTRGALEAAAGLCLARTHYDIEIEHFLMKLLDVPPALEGRAFASQDMRPDLDQSVQVTYLVSPSGEIGKVGQNKSPANHGFTR